MVCSSGLGRARAFRLCVLVLAGAWFAGCAPAKVAATSEDCTAGVSRPERSTLRLCGQLDREVVDHALALIDGDVRTIAVTSSGGSGADALRLGRRMAQDDIALSVIDICASACAHFLFVPAATVMVEPGSVVLFHHTDFALTKLADQVGIDVSPVTRARAIQQREFYAERGLPEALLADPMARIEPQCVGRMADGRIYAATRLRTYMPTRASIDAVRATPVRGFWPTSVAEAGRLAEAHAPESVPLIFGGDAAFQRLDANPAVTACEQT